MNPSTRSGACPSCLRARLLFVGLCLVAGVSGSVWHGRAAQGATPVAAVPAPAVAPASSTPVLTPIPAPAMPAEPASVSAAPASQAHRPPGAGASPVLLYRTVPLRTARLGQSMRPLTLVEHLNPAHELELEGELPPGLALGRDGVVRGTPTASGVHRFKLLVVEAASQAVVTQQAYALRVVVPKAAAPVAPSAPAAPARLQELDDEGAGALADAGRGLPVTYKLTPADLATLVPTETTEVGDAAELQAAAGEGVEPEAPLPAMTTVTAAALLPTIEQLQAMLTPLVDVEFPTRALFEQALQASRCAYFSAHVTEQATKQNLQVDATCPPAPGTAAAGRASRGGAARGLSLDRFHLALLPDDLAQQVVVAAEKVHPIEQYGAPRWSASCGCHVPDPANAVYGIFPYWLATDEAQPVDFSVFTRIGLMGAVVQDDGSLLLPRGFTATADSPARLAARHGTGLDLVVYRRDWRALLRQPATRRAAMAQAAADHTVRLLDTRFADGTSRWLTPLLWPAWRGEQHLYGGVTVFFDHVPANADEQRAFKAFHAEFVRELIARMKAAGRPYALNLVVPAQQLGDEDGAYGFKPLYGHLEAAQATASASDLDFTGRLHADTDAAVSVQYLVLLGEPTSTQKKWLRARIDEGSVLRGQARVEFLRRVVPLQFSVRADKPLPLTHERTQRIADDLAYMQWNFAGNGFWPVPVVGRGHGEGLRDLIAASSTSPWDRTQVVCDLVCPRRVGLRLLFQVLLVVDVLALAVYAGNCHVRRVGGRRLLLGLWAGLLGTLLVAAGLFTCDPGLQALRTGNIPLYVLAAVMCLGGAYATFKRQTDPP